MIKPTIKKEMKNPIGIGKRIEIILSKSLYPKKKILLSFTTLNIGSKIIVVNNNRILLDPSFSTPMKSQYLLNRFFIFSIYLKYKNTNLTRY